jgi:hypothetical protein
MAINDLNISSRFRPKANIPAFSKNNIFEHNLKYIVDHPTKIDKIEFNNDVNPLYSGIKEQPSFKGGFLGYKQFHVSEHLKNYATELTTQLGPQYCENYGNYIDTFLNKVKTDKNFRQSLHINEESLKRIEKGEWIGIPQKGIANRFWDEFSKPLKKIVGIKPNEQDAKIIKNFAQVQEFMEGIINRDIAYRKKFGIEDKTEEILIPPETIIEKIFRKRSKDIKHEYYSFKDGQAANRLTSGIIGAIFLGVDSFNTTMNLTKEKYESKKEGITRFMQEMGRLAITVYATDLIIKTFKKESARSMKWALATSAMGVLVAEFAGRWLVGKPILPSSKEKIDKLEQKAKNRTGISALVGNMLSGEFLIQEKQKVTAKTKEHDISAVSLSSNSGGNAALLNNTVSPVAFTGKYKQIITGSEKVTLYNNPEHLSNIISVFEKVDNEYATWLKRNIISCLKKHEIFKNQDIKENLAQKGINVEDAKSSELIQHFADIMQAFGDKEVPLGKKQHSKHKWVRSIFAPVFWINNGLSWINNKIQKIFTKKLTIQEKITFVENELEEKKLLDQFNKIMDHPRTANIRNKSKLAPDEMRLKMMEEYLDIKGGKLDENIQGVRASISWLENTLSNLKVEYKAGGKTVSYTTSYKVEDFLNAINQGKDKKKIENELAKIKNELFESFKKIDGKPEKGYDHSDHAVLSYPITKGLSSAFIISDIYNLSMLHSDGDKDVSMKNAKDRTVQELSRILWTQYIIGLTQAGIFKEAYDKSLKAAIGTVTLNGLLRETISRKVVNVPITPQSYEELVENQKKSQEASGPIKSTMAKIMGKNKNIYDKSTDRTNVLARPIAEQSTSVTSHNENIVLDLQVPAQADISITIKGSPVFAKFMQDA